VSCFIHHPAGPADNPGINSRALAELFKLAQERSAEVAYSLSASVLEIYQEQIFDLLTGSKDTGESVRQSFTAVHAQAL
jgi:kinesin family protein C2/C3